MIYLSEFEVDKTIERNNSYESVLSGLLRIFKLNDWPFYRSNEFTSYEEIERRINQSDVIIALLDKYWTSSTWKLHEVMWPLEKYNSMSGTKLDEKNRTVILCWIEDVICYPLENVRGEVINAKCTSEIQEHLREFFQKLR